MSTSQFLLVIGAALVTVLVVAAVTYWTVQEWRAWCERPDDTSPIASPPPRAPQDSK
ncbi:MAG: hypothetical protein U1D55_18605 [Phycisphaerae bacterium]